MILKIFSNKYIFVEILFCDFQYYQINHKINFLYCRFDQLSIRRVRNWEADQELRKKGIDPASWKSKKKEAKLAFQATIAPTKNHSGYVLTTYSRLFLCSMFSLVLIYISLIYIYIYLSTLSLSDANLSHLENFFRNICLCITPIKLFLWFKRSVIRTYRF